VPPRGLAPRRCVAPLAEARALPGGETSPGQRGSPRSGPDIPGLAAVWAVSFPEPPRWTSVLGDGRGRGAGLEGERRRPPVECHVPPESQQRCAARHRARVRAAWTRLAVTNASKHQRTNVLMAPSTMTVLMPSSTMAVLMPSSTMTVLMPSSTMTVLMPPSTNEPTAPRACAPAAHPPSRAPAGRGARTWRRERKRLALHLLLPRRAPRVLQALGSTSPAALSAPAPASVRTC